MAIKLMLLAALVACASAGIMRTAEDLARVEYEPLSRSHVESRTGQYTRGSYYADGPDGSRRVTMYTVDPVNGLHGVVFRQPIAPQQQIGYFAQQPSAYQHLVQL